MFRKFLLGTLSFAIFLFGANVSAFAQSRAFENNEPLMVKPAVSAAQKPANSNLKKDLFEKQAVSEIKEKDNLAAYQRQKAQGNKFSTTTKVLIGVAIAAAVVGIVIYAASKDEIKTF